MGTPAFNPSGSYEVPAFDPSASYESAPNASAVLPPGVRVVGKNAAGQPIYGPEERPSDASLYGQALFNPVGSGAHDQGIVGGLEQIGGRAMQAITAPILHPIDTLTGLGKTIVAAIPGGNQLVPDNPIDQRVQEFGQEWKKSPALALENTAGDVAGAVEGGRVGGAVVNKAQQVAGPAVSRALLMGKTPQEAYESALKPSTTIPQSQRTALVNTALKNELPVSKGGLERLQSRVDALESAIEDQIASNPNAPIDPNAAAQGLNQVKSRFANQVIAQPDLNTIEAARQQFLAERGAKPGVPAVPPQPTGLLDAQGRPIMNAGTPAQPPQPAPPMTAADAQAMKRGTYQVLKGKYGEQGSALVEAQKGLAYELRQQIANQFPEINKLNAQQGALLNLEPFLERAVGRISNHQFFGIGTPMIAAGVKAATGSGVLGTAAAIYKGILDDPFVKSRLAIAVSKGGGIPYAQALAKITAYSGSLESNAGATQASQGDQTGNK